jgi:protein subunit release factor B
VFSDIDQDVIGLRLPAEARPRSAEGRMTSVLAAVLQQSENIINVARSDDDLRNEAIRAGIGGVANKVNSSVENLVLADQLRQRLA